MISRATRLMLLGLFVLSGSYCALAQTATTQPTSTPGQQDSQPSQTPNESSPANQPAQNPGPTTEQSAPSVPAATAKPRPASPAPKPPVLRHRKRRIATKKSLNQTGAKQSTDQPGKVVVRNGGEKDESAQLSPAITPEQAQRQRASAASLLAATDANLKQISARQLSKDEQATLDEIRAYMRQAKAASAAGDTNRAHTLAYKARLLSDELARK